MISLSEDRILDFLDGRLATPDEEELLHTLAVSPERRQVLREHMKLREVTQSLSREQRFAVPTQVTEQLFSRLEEVGYSAPTTVEALLSKAPEVAGVAGASTLATTMASGWRIGASTLVTVSVMSFLLGVGAYYVFGSSLGLRTRSQIAAAKHHAVTRHMASVSTAPAQQFDVASAQPITASLPLDIANIIEPTKNNVVSDLSLQPSTPQLPVTNEAIVPKEKDDYVAPPITYTAPLKSTFAATSAPPRVLPGVLPFWPSVIPSPFAKDKGTIGVRFAVGPSPSSTTSQMNTLTEFAFQWSMWDYMIARASIGQLNSYERVAEGTQGTLKNQPGVYQISTPVGNGKSVTLIGMDAGVSLAKLGVPLEALVGVMYSGGAKDYSQFYERGSLMLHFEPWRLLTVSAGLEGLVYTHYLQNSIDNEKKFLNGYTTKTVNAMTQETCGIVGPSLEIGWHF